ncbi:MAG TPA: BON domain-containing protein, partial [Phyllobacterium sp.]|nr:BON domain-containing protein [Phyllobacterium sp.]
SGLIVGGIAVTRIRRRLYRERTLGLEKQSEWQGLLIWVRVRSPEKEAESQEILIRHGGEAVHVHEIERDVRDELNWDPDLNADDIAVSVKNGVVTLAGFTRSYYDRLEAEAAAKRVAGVHAVANDIEVRLPAIDQRPDPDIAKDAVAALKSELPISHDKIKVVVKNGWITLEGTAEWQYQKTSAETAVRKVKGVKSVTNVITVKPKVEPSELKRKIQDAFKRSAEVDADRITVEANGSVVTLKGTVRSWIEREEAERVAWSAPGVTRVEDRIVVSP